MHGRLPHFAFEGGRYWFTPFLSVIEYVEKRAAEKLRGPRLELYRVLADKARVLLVKRERGGIVERGEDKAVLREVSDDFLRNKDNLLDKAFSRFKNSLGRLILELRNIGILSSALIYAKNTINTLNLSSLQI